MQMHEMHTPKRKINLSEQGKLILIYGATAICIKSLETHFQDILLQSGRDRVSVLQGECIRTPPYLSKHAIFGDSSYEHVESDIPCTLSVKVGED
jgi:hypothetical protein